LLYSHTGIVLIRYKSILSY